MADLTPSFLSKLQDHSLPPLDPGDHFIFPEYDGKSILNIPGTICQWLDVPGFGERPLEPKITDSFVKGIRKVILVLVDGLSFHRFKRWLNNTQVWQDLIEDGLLAPLTSVIPSTTSTNITTLWTGRSPATHGIIGYEMWLKEYAMVANMILHSPMTFQDEPAGSLQKAGFSPLEFLDLPTLGTHLRNHGVKPLAFSHYSIANSGLTQMLMKDVEVLPFQTPASLWISVQQLLHQDPNSRRYIWVYWGQLDGISHYYGPDDERAKAEFTHFSTAFEKFFLAPLNPHARRDTLVILTSDHGQAYTPLNPNNLIGHHPQLNQHMRLKPTCENRFASLYLRPGMEEYVREYFHRVFPNRFTLIKQEEALQAGLFGPGPHHPDLIHRLGDLIAVAHKDAYLWWSNQKDFLLGRHGGLHPDEILVPFLAGRL